MDQYYRQALRFIEGLGIQEWLLVLFGVVVVGLLCMRGFGSRSNY